MSSLKCLTANSTSVHTMTKKHAKGPVFHSYLASRGQMECSAVLHSLRMYQLSISYPEYARSQVRCWAAPNLRTGILWVRDCPCIRMNIARNNILVTVSWDKEPSSTQSSRRLSNGISGDWQLPWDSCLITGLIPTDFTDILFFLKCVTSKQSSMFSPRPDLISMCYGV
jgi:hypothetical protein